MQVRGEGYQCADGTRRVSTVRGAAAVAAVVLALMATRAAAFTPFSGVASNVPLASLDGWSICYQDNYNHSGTALATILGACSGDHLMLACRPVGSSTLTLAAYAPRADVIFDTGTGNTPHNANGVGWYFNGSHSWGFAPQGSPINRNSCDIVNSNSFPTGATDGDQRICFHTSGGAISAGWRCGRVDFLQSSSGYERVILQATCNNDGVVDGFEQCDDGNSDDGDGCSSGCLIEECWGCVGAPSSCSPLAATTSCTDDGNVCTSDVCDGAGACVHPGDVPAGTACPDDGDVCTSDACDGAGACVHPGDVPAGTACPDDGNVCTSDACDGAGTCVHPPLAAGTACPDDGNLCTSDACDGAGTCAHPGDIAAGTPCPDDGSLCTSDTCDGAGTCAHVSVVDCAAINQCLTDPGVCDPSTGTCTLCPVGYSAGGGGCQRTYAIDASLLDDLDDTSCGPPHRYNGCFGAFGFHWTDTGDDGVGAVIGVDLRIEAGISCSGTPRTVMLNGDPVGSYDPAGTCSCGSPHAPRLLGGVDVSSYVKGGPNAVLITDDPGDCDGLSDDGSGAYAVVTVTYAAPVAAPLPDGTDCDDGLFCNGADTCTGGACGTHAGDPCPGPDGDTDCAESCDESTDSCSGIDQAGSLCRAATGDCDLAETCDGVSPTCPADAPEADGTACDDGSVCTQIDTCQGGTCTGTMPLACDDGIACTTDSCDPVAGCLNAATPASGCLTSEKSLLLIKDKDDDTKDKLLWKWIKGAELTQPQLADPTDATGYALCIYAGDDETLIADAALPPGDGWSAIGNKGYKFKGTSPNGLTNAILKGGAAGKSKALAKGKGAALPDPVLPLASPVTVQLRRDGSALCLESRFTAADEKKNEAGQFKARQ